MDFARKQLEKYGWKEGIIDIALSENLTTKFTLGQGLGRNEDGISTPIKPKLKFDNRGVGHSLAKEFTENWWEKTYNTAASNIDVRLQNKHETNPSIQLLLFFLGEDFEQFC